MCAEGIIRDIESVTTGASSASSLPLPLVATGPSSLSLAASSGPTTKLQPTTAATASAQLRWVTVVVPTTVFIVSRPRLKRHASRSDTRRSRIRIIAVTSRVGARSTPLLP